MNAVRINNRNYKVIEVRGSFVYYNNEKNKVTCVATSSVEMVDVDDEDIFSPKYSGTKSKKVNPANFMSKEEWAKSKYSTMSNDDFEEERENDKRTSKSW